MAQTPTGTIASDRLPNMSGRILISGGAGFLGRAIIRRATRERWPCNITVLSRDEEKQQRLSLAYPAVRCLLGDVRDAHNLDIAMRGQDGVIHAAAVKFIPEAEFNVMETIKTNIDGSRNVARSAVKAGVRHVIGVSTDKSALPCNVYGMTKGVMERMFTEANTWSDTRFSLVRYGNVVGSTGSIIPLFKRQLAEHGEVTLTDPHMTRFWISPDNAVDLLLLAAARGVDMRGRIFVPRCGAMTMQGLADLIVHSGFPTKQALGTIKVIGARPGEKQHEDLIHYQEAQRADLLGDYYVVHPATMRGESGGKTYTSSYPAMWITPDQMLAMIEDSENV